MKSTKFIFTLLFATISIFSNAQTTYEWEEPIKPIEKQVDEINITVDGGRNISYVANGKAVWDDNVKSYDKKELYEKIKSAAQEKYGNRYPQFFLRNFHSKTNILENSVGFSVTYSVSASVVIIDVNAQRNELLSQALDKVLRNLREGSRLAIEQVSVINGINREDIKDLLVDMLLDKGYKVVAKEYLEKLMKEQEAQRSGIYNDNTTVTDNNFTAVGYYINVKVTESSLRVQVVNVSTGEYEGNATINF
jgi:hypothetical protein